MSLVVATFSLKRGEYLYTIAQAVRGKKQMKFNMNHKSDNKNRKKMQKYFPTQQTR